MRSTMVFLSRGGISEFDGLSSLQHVEVKARSPGKDAQDPRFGVAHRQIFRRLLLYTFVYNRAMTATEIRRLRHRLGLSQSQLAAVVGVPANTIARWERGEMEMRPSMDRLVRLAVAEAERQRSVTKRRTRSRR